MNRLFARLLLAVCLLGSLPALAQNAGSITGQVTDSESLAIPNAKVQLLDQASNIVQDTTTNDTGNFTIQNLSAGNYRVLVQADGFDHYQGELVKVSDGETVTANVTMKIQSSQTVVQVNTSNAGHVELDTATLSGSLSQKEVTSYGLNGRNFTQLSTLTPGVSNQTGQDEAKVGLAGSAKYSVNGGRVEYNTFEVDGVDVLNSSINASRGQGLPLEVYPSIDAIQDMKVLTSNYGAMYGKTASGSVEVTTKSGTASLHGNIYAFIRNEMFNARNYFDQPVPEPSTYTGKPVYKTPLYRRQDYGGTIGGPIFIPNHYNTTKDKSFFFFSEELRLEKTPVTYNQAVPTVAERNGDFSNGGLDLCPNTVFPYQGGTSDCPTYARQGGRVNVNYTAQALLASNIIPLPNSATGCNSTNPSPFDHCYNASISPPTYWREELFRIDHAITPSELLAFRYVHDSWNTTTLTPQWGIVLNSFPTVQNRLNGPGINMVLSLAQTLPHQILNRIALSYSNQTITLSSQAGPGVSSLSRPGILDAPCTLVTGPQPTPINQYPQGPQKLTECPMGYIFNNGFGGGKMPGLVFSGNNGAYGGHGFAVDTGYAPWEQSNPTYTLRDDLTKQFGNHLLQVGLEIDVVQQNQQSAANGANTGDTQGLLTFSNQQSRGTSGNAFADFLAGPGIDPLTGCPPPTTDSGTTTCLPGGKPIVGESTGAIKTFQQDSGTGRYYNRYNQLDFYVQDDWKATPRLTLTAGIRFSIFGTWYNAKGSAYNWEPGAYSQSLGNSIHVDQGNGFLVRNAGSNGGLLPAVPLNLSNLDPVITNGLVQCGVGNVPKSCMGSHLFNPAPRVGLSWDPFGNGRTAIRAGYGLFWEHGTSFEANTGSLIGGAPLILSETQTFPSGGTTSSSDSSVQPSNYNNIGLPCLPATSNCPNTTAPGNVTFPLNVTSIPTQAVYPYIQQWSLSVQRDLGKSFVASLAYVGSKGTHLSAERDLNQLQPLSPGLNPFIASHQPITSAICQNGATHSFFPVNGDVATSGSGSTPGIGVNSPGYNNMYIACTGNPGFTSNNVPLGISADTLRPYTGFSNILSIENQAVSSYNGLQATMKQTLGTFTLGVSYTYSHSIDDSSDRASANFANSLDLKSNRASSDFDQRQMLNVSYVYTLPLMRLFSIFSHFVPYDDATVNAGTSPVSRDDDTPAWESSVVAKTLLNGWDLSGITMFMTGSPFSVINGGSSSGCNYPGVTFTSCGLAAADNAGVGDGIGIGSYVDKVGNPKGPKPKLTSSSSNVGPLLYDPRAYAAPAALTFGTSGRNSLNNPARTQFNISLLKHFTARHQNDLEFRAEVFNLFNHTQFRIYDPTHPGNTGNNVANCYGGVVTGYNAGSSIATDPSNTDCLTGNSFLHPVDAHDPRIMQFGLKMAF